MKRMRSSLLWITLLFVGVIVVFGEKQGVRSLVSLAGSFAAIIYILLPLLRQGYSPGLVSVVVGAIVLFCAIYFTHGFNKQSSVAFCGTVIGVVCTGLLAYLSIEGASLSGFTTEDTVYLNFSTQGGRS